MIFETLYDSAQRGELMLVGGGMCHWHLRRDGQLTIREIISTRPGAGSQMLRRLEAVPGATSLFAKCPAGLDANEWYTRRGFHVERAEWPRSGRMLLCWRKALRQDARRPNVGNLEVIYCADGNARFAEIAIDAGMLYGARLPARGLSFRPYFTDQEWRQPDRARYMDALAEHHPHMATVLDLERWQQLDEVLSWSEEAARYAQTVVIIPKAHHIIAELPRAVGGAQVRLGYSVPTRYAGTTVQLHEFEGWPVHLLGGSPEKQMALYRLLDVRSVDTNLPAKVALNNNKSWSLAGWLALEAHYQDGPYEAFRRSCNNVMAAWRAIVQQPRAGVQDGRQLALWHGRELEAQTAS